MNNKAEVWADLTPSDLIERMYERTNADGVLYVPSFFTDEDFEGEKSLRCVMGWEKPDDCFAVLQEYDQLRSAIEQIAERCDRGGNYDEGGYEALTEKQKVVWDTYLTLSSSDMDCRIAEAKKRLGDSPFAFYTILCAMRYWKLLTLEAPDLILNNEAKALAFALTLFRWCKRYEYVDSAVRCHFDRLNQTE